MITDFGYAAERLSRKGCITGGGTFLMKTTRFSGRVLALMAALIMLIQQYMDYTFSKFLYL